MITLFGFIEEFAVFHADVDNEFVGGMINAVHINYDDIGNIAGVLNKCIFVGFIGRIFEGVFLPSKWMDTFLGVGEGIIG